MKVYIVTSGSYSDYMIHRVFLDKHKAQIYADLLYDSNEIEEYDTSDDNLDVYVGDKGRLMVDIFISDNDVDEITFRDCLEPDNKFRFCGAKGDYLNCLYYRKMIDYDINKHDELKAKYLKAAHDLFAHCKYLHEEGFADWKINEMINKSNEDKQ